MAVGLGKVEGVAVGWPDGVAGAIARMEMLLPSPVVKTTFTVFSSKPACVLIASEISFSHAALFPSVP